MSCYTFFWRIIQNNLNIRDLGEFQSKENEIYNRTKEADLGGFIPIYHSRFQIVNEDRFAVSICTLEGQRFNFDNSESYVCMHQIASIVCYLISSEQHSEHRVDFYLGALPRRKLFDSLELKDGIPHNLLIISGIIANFYLIYQNESIKSKYELYS